MPPKSSFDKGVFSFSPTTATPSPKHAPGSGSNPSARHQSRPPEYANSDAADANDTSGASESSNATSGGGTIGSGTTGTTGTGTGRGFGTTINTQSSAVNMGSVEGSLNPPMTPSVADSSEYSADFSRDGTAATAATAATAQPSTPNAAAASSELSGASKFVTVEDHLRSYDATQAPPSSGPRGTGTFHTREPVKEPNVQTIATSQNISTDSGPPPSPPRSPVASPSRSPVRSPATSPPRSPVRSPTASPTLPGSPGGPPPPPPAPPADEYIPGANEQASERGLLASIAEWELPAGPASTNMANIGQEEAEATAGAGTGAGAGTTAANEAGASDGAADVPLQQEASASTSVGAGAGAGASASGSESASGSAPPTLHDLLPPTLRQFPPSDADAQPYRTLTVARPDVSGRAAGGAAGGGPHEEEGADSVQLLLANRNSSSKGKGKGNGSGSSSGSGSGSGSGNGAPMLADGVLGGGVGYGDVVSKEEQEAAARLIQGGIQHGREPTATTSNTAFQSLYGALGLQQGALATDDEVKRAWQAHTKVKAPASNDHWAKAGGGASQSQTPRRERPTTGPPTGPSTTQAQAPPSHDAVVLTPDIAAAVLLNPALKGWSVNRTMLHGVVNES